MSHLYFVILCQSVLARAGVMTPRAEPGDPTVAASWRQLAAAVSHPSACTACTAYGTV